VHASMHASMHPSMHAGTNTRNSHAANRHQGIRGGQQVGSRRRSGNSKGTQCLPDVGDVTAAAWWMQQVLSAGRT